jgi:threonine dehydrogenase-like Zn-dependent dehydrogenase
MKGWILHGANDLELKELEIPELKDNSKVKVKLTKSMITVDDVLRYTGETKVNDIVLGSAGIGILSDENKDDLFSNQDDQNKIPRVYVNPYKPCKECYTCKSNSKAKCSHLKIAGEDYNGFLREFVYPDSSQVFPIPDSISDKDALLIETVSLALSTIDRLNVQKGEHVVIIGADTLGITLAQLLKYYQSLPIIIDNDPQKIQLASDCGIYYALTKEKEWMKEVTDITGGRMANHVIYLQQSKIPVKTAFQLAGYGVPVAIVGETASVSQVSFSIALKKELKLEFVSNGYGNTLSSINLIANKAIDFSKINVATTSFENCGEKFKELSEKLENDQPIYNVIVDLVGL